MASISRVAPATPSNLVPYVERSLEVLWLFTAALIPLLFVPTDFVLSEAVNAYVEVPKTTALRALAGIMTILWIVEWVLKGGLYSRYTLQRLLLITILVAGASGLLGAVAQVDLPLYAQALGLLGFVIALIGIAISLFRVSLAAWLNDQVSRWIVVAATIYTAVTIIATLVSQNFFISVWGEVSGQYGYSAYTTVSYFMIFAVISTHLKTQDQLWRILGVMVATGALIALYGILQHYGLDPLDVGESGSVRVASTMANPVFTGAALVATTLLTLGVGLAVLDRMGWTPLRIGIWVALFSAQLITLYWTFSRGSWLIGLPVGLVAFLTLPLLKDAFSGLLRRSEASPGAMVALGGTVILGLAVLSAQVDLLDVRGLGPLPGLPDLPYVQMLLGIVAFLGWASLLVLLSPTQLSEPIRTFAKTCSMIGAALVITVLVDVLTPGKGIDSELEFKGGIILTIAAVLLGVGAVSATALLLLPRVSDGIRLISKIGLVIGSAALIAVFAASLTNNPLVGGGPANLGGAAIAESELDEQLATAESQITGRGLSFRTDIWEASTKLVINRPWFEYEGLSHRYLRPLVGYGPEMFKYTFPLESPLGGLLSHAHNFILHHFVEQGVLGLFSSLGLFIAFFGVGLGLLLSHWREYSTTHKWVLITLLATMLGRLGEMMVGVARESDLIFFWIMLAIMVVLPTAMNPASHGQRCAACGASHTADARSCPSCGVALEVSPVPEPQTLGRSARPQRSARRDRQERGRREAQRSTSARGPLGPAGSVAIVLVPVLIVFIGWLTWDKNVDYAVAAVVAARGQDKFLERDITKSEDLMKRATEMAPDVPIYYHNLAGIYNAYQNAYDEAVTNNPGAEVQTCEQAFGLEPSASGRPEKRCSEESYFSNLEGFRKNKTSPQAKLVLANSTLLLAQLGYEGKDEEALGYYRELIQMIPSSWPLHNALGGAYLNLGLPAESVTALSNSISLTGESGAAAQAYHLTGLARRQLGELEEARLAFERSLQLFGGAAGADQVRPRLTETYDLLGKEHLREGRTQEARAIYTSSVRASTGTPLPGQVDPLEVNRLLSAAYSSIAVEHLQSQRPQEALDLLKTPMELLQGLPDSSVALYLQGAAYSDLGELEKARDSLVAALAINDNDPNAANVHNKLGEIYSNLGERVLADEQAALALNSQALSQLQEGLVEDALASIARSLAITGETAKSSTAYYLRGVAQQQAGDLDKAVESMEKSLQLSPDGSNAGNAHTQLAQIYTQQGDQAKADEHSKLAEASNPP